MTVYHTKNTLESLKTLYQQGYRSEVVDKAVAKIVAMEIEQAEQTIADLELRLSEFEKRHQMTSMEFYERFQTGGLGDDVEFVEWSAFVEMRDATRSWIEILNRDLE